MRTIPKSRHNPQFAEEQLAPALQEAGMAYKRIARLGGLRRTTSASVNTGWRNTSFRGYADYMGSDEFQEGLRELEQTALQHKVAIMCAEAVPWRCHRSLVADALTTRGWSVLHIQSAKTANLHKLTPFLQVHNGELSYPPVVE